MSNITVIVSNIFMCVVHGVSQSHIVQNVLVATVLSCGTLIVQHLGQMALSL